MEIYHSVGYTNIFTFFVYLLYVRNKAVDFIIYLEISVIHRLTVLLFLTSMVPFFYFCVAWTAIVLSHFTTNTSALVINRIAQYTVIPCVAAWVMW